MTDEAKAVRGSKKKRLKKKKSRLQLLEKRLVDLEKYVRQIDERLKVAAAKANEIHFSHQRF